ncbi:IS3 family transposase [Agathobaculum hominis]
MTVTIEYLNYYNDRRIKANLKGLPPSIHKHQTLSVPGTISTLNFF